MTDSTLKGLYEVVKNRKENPEEGSYTCYLFDKGLDKILKKCGEENAEMIIAAKNHDNDELANEMCDLIYHMLVLMVENGVSLEDVMDILEQRRQKIGNLKTFHQVDKES
ncbi:phosphoribosyl-ATP diphosphatase [Paludicola sp. MB14-C6]|uniref:phosphoribosyl-ATP diphosphatase n=1 Tax=Paludihabitans sp. MB14-C6 TaxID=3070656 RepID=UPI0027DBA4EE|nr:phosphoribosyl-ATP diphosphatase [Paludicola sp. MB14-C6]WMJ23623.1 phosphoribosyl-ATP diphosphatase [Paludicola sp. MB14-C6]